MVNKDKEECLVIKDNQREKFSQFMERLSEDPVLRTNREGSPFSLTEIMHEARYPLNQESQYDHECQELIPVIKKPMIDVALLLTLVLREKGLNCTSDDLMNHVLGGGSVEQFIQQAHERNEE